MLYKLVTDRLLHCLQDTISAIKCAIGAKNGIATLDSTGNVPADQLGNVSGGGGDVSSVFGRTGAVVASSGDYTFAKIGSTPTTLAGYGITNGQTTLSLTTTGTSGASTLSGSTLNIPNYATTGGVTSLAGTANQITSSGSTGAITLSLPTNTTINGLMTVGSGSGIQWGNNGTAGTTYGYLIPRSDGIFEWGNGEANPITRLMFGASSTSNPALVTNGTGFSIKTTDSSTFTNLTAAKFVTNGGASTNFVMGDGSLATSTGTGTIGVLSASPALTGTPTAPTAAALTNTTQVATTAYVLANSGKAFLTSGSVSAAATLPINLSSYYASYNFIEIRVYNILPATASGSLYLNVSANGTTYDNSSGNYAWTFGYANTSPSAGVGPGVASDTKIILMNALNITTLPSFVSINIITPNTATYFPTIQWDGTSLQASGTLARVYGSGQRLANQLTKGIQLSMSAGNISGSYSVYGYN